MSKPENFNVNESVRSKVDTIMTTLHRECVYGMNELSGHNPEEGHYEYQPTVTFDTNNERGMTVAELTAYVEALQNDLDKAGISVRIDIKTYPSHHIVVDLENERIV